MENQPQTKSLTMTNEFERALANYSWKILRFPSGQIRSLRSRIPNVPGVYILRAPHELPRVNDFSNVVYIGKAGTLDGTKQGLQGRLFNTRGSAEKWVREYIERKFEGDQFELHFTELPGQDPRLVEEELLRGYLMAYGELPPANHQSVKIE